MREKVIETVKGQNVPEPGGQRDWKDRERLSDVTPADRQPVAWAAGRKAESGLWRSSTEGGWVFLKMAKNGCFRLSKRQKGRLKTRPRAYMCVCVYWSKIWGF